MRPNAFDLTPYTNQYWRWNIVD